MTTTRSVAPNIIQIHFLHSSSATLINRDQSGMAKRMPFGDAMRTRISSQCLKRHWRVAEDKYSLANLGVPMAIRSRATLSMIKDRLVVGGISESMAQAAAEGLRMGGLLDKGKDMTGEDALASGQAILMGRAEINYLVTKCAEAVQGLGTEKEAKEAVAKWLKSEKKNIEALKHGAGLESALFGRMITSDVLSNRDAAIYVAHSFTTHAAQVENDYFTVVDDILSEAGETGSAGIFDTELTSGLYYGYVVIDVAQLVANLEGVAPKQWAGSETNRELAGRVAQHLLHLIATVSPGAKKGSTAPFEWARFLMVEAGDLQPRSLAGAFQNALPLNTTSLAADAVERIAAEVAAFDEAFGEAPARRFMSLTPSTVHNATKTSLPEIGNWVKSIIEAGVVEVSAPAAEERV